MKSILCTVVLLFAVVCSVMAGGNPSISNRVQSPLATVLSITPDTVRFDTTCNTTSCKTISIKNIGTKIIDNIRSDSSLQQPFQLGNALKAKSLGVGNSTTLSVCFKSQTSTNSRDTIHLFADLRDPFNLAMLFDVSNSMGDPISNKDFTMRITAAKSAGNKFLDAIYGSTRTTPDTCAVYSFAGTNTFTINRDFTTNKQLLSTAISNLGLRSGTCLYYGIASAAKRLAARKNPILVVLSDGANNGCGATDTENSCIQEAIKAGVKVYVIGIVDVTDRNEQSYITILRNIATKTGGKLYTAVTTAEIDNAYADIIARLSADVEFIIPVFGKTGSANIEILPKNVWFDSVKIGTERCTTITVKNSGSYSGTVTQDMLIPTSGDFFISNSTAIPFGILQPDSSFSFDICFRPSYLREHLWNGTQIMNTCFAASQFALHGTGYDSVVIRMNTFITVVPGLYIPIPLQLLNILPKAYGVDSIRFTVAYNATMLDTAAVPLIADFTSASPLRTMRLYKTSFSGDTMFVQYSLRGSVMDQPTQDSTLLHLQYRVLNSSVMSTPITITSFKFADGNPKVGIIQPAMVQLDSVCYQAQRLLNTSDARNTVRLRTVNKIQNGEITVQYSSLKDISASLSLYTTTGQQVWGNDCQVLQTGTHGLTFYIGSLPVGNYYFVVHCTNGDTHYCILPNY